MSWLDKALELVAGGEVCVLVTVAQTRGSTPREAGAKMLVWEGGTLGTVGGGQLELSATVRARAILDDASAPKAATERLSLGPQLAQCCGGSIALLFERLDATALLWLQAWAGAADSGRDVIAITSLRDDTAWIKVFEHPTLAATDLPSLVAERLPTFV